MVYSITNWLNYRMFVTEGFNKTFFVVLSSQRGEKSEEENCLKQYQCLFKSVNCFSFRWNVDLIRGYVTSGILLFPCIFCHNRRQVYAKHLSIPFEILLNFLNLSKNVGYRQGIILIYSIIQQRKHYIFKNILALSFS